MNMSQAFLLINCASGNEKKVVDKLQKLDEVKEISKTFGIYDIVAKVESISEKDLQEIISAKIRNIIPVRSVLILATQ